MLLRWFASPLALPTFEATLSPTPPLKHNSPPACQAAQVAVGTHKGRAALSGALLDRAWRQGALNSAEGRGGGRKPAGGQQALNFQSLPMGPGGAD